ncbi:hypothetical protein QQG09_08340 [Melissococcus plutonius]|nr:hypothetical protein [Melissococcus plutonius]MCV2520387.1 hypothetical protein [Melissococcus plutonius]
MKSEQYDELALKIIELLAKNNTTFRDAKIVLLRASERLEVMQENSKFK